MLDTNFLLEILQILITIGIFVIGIIVIFITVYFGLYTINMKKKGGVWLPLGKHLYQCTNCKHITSMIKLNKYCSYCGERKILDIRRNNVY